ncbi:zinc finger CCHC domain-containing protein 8-like isoform X2 [Dreissena polymorpha]|uniref:zinc finger CCHC domain-containing protein 8-like isoform X2 n=1 Tax=Dreissena polymorpha TaxID=45954 RepID=UPI00226569A3|nr:zinc finger CCHC domain-containing protein 8-like isoform X2 [Dreissena polymorpha]
MADDCDVLFGDSELFDEFEKEREPSGSFIIFENDAQGSLDKSKFVFQESNESSSDDTTDDELEEKMKVKQNENSVAFVVGKLRKQHSGSLHNGNKASSDGESSSEAEDGPVRLISKDRQNQANSYKLNYERNKFKQYCNIIDSTRNKPDEESAAVQIIFQNNSFSRKYKTQIEDFVYSLLEKDKNQPHETLQKLDLRSTVPSCSDINDKIPVEKRTDKMFQAHAIIGCSQFYRCCLLDTLGWPLVEYNPSLTDSWDIPTYEQVFTDVLPLDMELVRANAKKKERERAKPKCWNCDGEHMLLECKLPRNQGKISENKKIFMASSNQQQRSKPTGGRYHVDANEDPRYSKYKPGVISEDLRSALGLEADQLPLYIYKMRAMGYPPGWMEDAKSAPGLSMFDKHGNDDSEIEAQAVLDVDKIIEYPGFTVEVPDGYADEWEMYGLPPLQPHQLKATLLAQTSSLAASKRQNDDEEMQLSSKKLKLEMSDMDLDGDDDSITGDDLMVIDSCEDDTNTGESSQNPIDLDTTQESVVNETDGGTSKCLIEIANDSIDSTADDFEFVKPRLHKSGSTTSIQTFGELGTGSPISSQPSTPTHSPFHDLRADFKGSVSKSRDFSTPIMKRSGSVDHLPSDSKFAVGIEDHIPFENLPNAIGNYEKMRDLIMNKIRKIKPSFSKKATE